MLAMRKHVKSDGNVHNMYVDFENTQIPVTHISEIRVLAPPWFVHTGRMEPNLYTGPEYWSLVIATNVLVAVLLLSASVRGVICDEGHHSVCFADGKCGEDNHKAYRVQKSGAFVTLSH